jgi:hypothetical protein
MDTTTFVVAVFCLIDDWMKGYSLRQRGPAPTLKDSEVLTMEIVGEFLGISTDSGIYHYFRRHFQDWFPALSQIHRTTFVHQAANLWRVKQQLWQGLIGLVEHDPRISITDSLPVPVFRFARAYRCQILAGGDRLWARRGGEADLSESAHPHASQFARGDHRFPLGAG